MTFEELNEARRLGQVYEVDPSDPEHQTRFCRLIEDIILLRRRGIYTFYHPEKKQLVSIREQDLE